MPWPGWTAENRLVLVGPARPETERGWLLGDSRPGEEPDPSSDWPDQVKSRLTLRKVVALFWLSKHLIELRVCPRYAGSVV